MNIANHFLTSSFVHFLRLFITTHPHSLLPPCSGHSQSISRPLLSPCAFWKGMWYCACLPPLLITQSTHLIILFSISLISIDHSIITTDCRSSSPVYFLQYKIVNLRQLFCLENTRYHCFEWLDPLPHILPITWVLAGSGACPSVRSQPPD